MAEIRISGAEVKSEQTDAVQKLTRSLRVGRALERVRAAVLRMEKSAEIADIAQIILEELWNLDFKVPRCSISIFDEAHNFYGGYHSLETSFSPRFSASENSERFIMSRVEGALDDEGTGYRQELIRAWRENRVFRYSVISTEQRAKAAEYFTKHSGIQMTAAELIKHNLLYVPFEFGVVGIGSERLDPDQFDQEDEHLLGRFGDAFADGYRRFLEVRDREIRQAVDRLTAEVTSMRQSGDIVDVILVMGEQFRKLGLKYTSCSISVIDDEARLVHLYAVTPALEGPDMLYKLRQVDRSYIPMLCEAREPILIRSVAPGYDLGYTFEAIDESLAGEERGLPPRIVRRTDQAARRVARLFARRWKIDPFPLESVPRSAIRVPFSKGSLAVTANEPGKYTHRDVNLVASFADALTLGFARSEDFRNLERRNRELETERAVERVQMAVQAMKKSEDLIKVITLASKTLSGLGIDFNICSISIVDQKAGRVKVYVTGPAHRLSLLANRKVEFPLVPFGPGALEVLEEGSGPFQFSEIPDAGDQIAAYMSTPLDSHHGGLQDVKTTEIISRTEDETLALIKEYEKRWKIRPWPKSMYIRSSVRVPFSGGTIALSASRPEAFGSREAQILERFTEAFSLGFARYLDFRRLKEQNQALEAASRMKSDFLANMSHEIRTPMNAIINFSSLILEGVYGKISEEMQDAVEEIDKNGETLLRLINDLLDLSKIEAGDMKLHLRRCCPRQCVENAVSALNYQAKNKGLPLITEIEADLPSLTADERRVTQHVLSNLIKNAIKFTAAGEVRVGVKRDGEDIRFWVSDTGIGIPEKEHESVFDSFHQVDGSMTREAEGTGLGLTIARRFVEMHGGRIWLESSQGEGSTFAFTIPLRNETEKGGNSQEDG